MSSIAKVFAYPLLIIFWAVWIICIPVLWKDPLKFIDYQYNDYVHECALKVIEESGHGVISYKLDLLDLLESENKFCKYCGGPMKDNLFEVITNQCPNCKTKSSGNFCTKCGTARETLFEEFDDISGIKAAAVNLAKFLYFTVFFLFFHFFRLDIYYGELLDDIGSVLHFMKERFVKEKKNEK